MRYFIRLSYRGTKYKGWQIQPNDRTVQETIEQGLSKILKTPIEITGCGRTDAGVHAKDYVAHFDVADEFIEPFKSDFPIDLLKRVNFCIPEDIAISSISKMPAEAHTRFDANHRAYEYHIVFSKTPFETDTAFLFPFVKDLDFEKLQAAAALLLEYDHFFPFCKTNTEVKTMHCKMYRSEWVIDQNAGRMVFHIAANRFLRGMVRLIVGMCLNVGTGKITLDTVRDALEKQIRLPKSLSVPPDGLYLVDIRYPYNF